MLTNDPFRSDERRVLARAAHRHVGGRDDGVLLELRQQVGVEPRQPVAAERRQHDRLVRRNLQQLADLFARLRRVAGDEGDVLDVREALEPARHRQPQRHRRLGVGAADRRQQRRRQPDARIVGVDPVPGEVAEADRRDAGRGADRKGQRRNVADDQPRAELAQRARLARGARHQIAVERRRATDAVGLVERQRVDLHDAGVGLQRAEGDLAFDRQVEQPSRRRGADADPGFGPAARMALMTSIEREAWPNPWPEI